MTPLSGCWRVDIACRRACRSPFLASVISFSTSGLTALALASVVLMRSWSMISTHRFASSALRCEASRDSLWRVFWWRISGSSRDVPSARPAAGAARQGRTGAMPAALPGPRTQHGDDRRSPIAGGMLREGPLVAPQVQASLRERLDDLVDRLLAEVRDRRQLALGLGDQVADGLDAGTLEAVVGPHPELELLDQDVVHRPPLAPAHGERPARRAGAVLERRDTRRAGAQLLDPVLVGEDRQRGDQDLGGLAQRGLRVQRAVGLDVERQLVEVRPLADARLLHLVGDAAHRREDRVDRDDADRLVGRLVLLGRAVAAAAADREVELE